MLWLVAGVHFWQPICTAGCHSDALVRCISRRSHRQEEEDSSAVLYRPPTMYNGCVGYAAATSRAKHTVETIRLSVEHKALWNARVCETICALTLMIRPSPERHRSSANDDAGTLTETALLGGGATIGGAAGPASAWPSRPPAI